MENGQPSLTALTAAAARAAHLIVDGEPTIFADTLASALLGDRGDELISYHRLQGTHPVLSGARVQVTCRSRYTEEALRRAIARGVTQLIPDYMLPEPMRDEAGSMYGTLVARASAERGEPWLSAFAPDQFAGLARGCGFADGGRHVGQRDTIPRALWTRADSLRPTGLAMLFHGTAAG
jgi:hypothetical protein